MNGHSRGSSGGTRPVLVALIVAATACVTAGLALATTFTVKVAKSSVTNSMGSTSMERIVVTTKGLAVYEETGDSKAYPKCTKANGCWANWPPVKVKSANGLSKGPGVPGKLGVWRHSGVIQLTLSGHPLYNYVVDQPHDAMGQGFSGFHVVRATG